VAKFALQNKAVKVLFNNKGNWTYTILTYYEDELPANVKNLVNNAYAGFDITLVQEIHQQNVTCYKVSIENCRNFKQVLVSDDNIALYEEFVKQ
jgi:hypothetical protein